MLPRLREKRLGHLLYAAALCGVASFACAASAAEIGQAVQVVSLVQGQSGGTTREIAVKDNVFSQEVIETGDDAATRMVFLDGTELSMGPSSVVVLDKYIYDPNQPATGQLVMNVVSGVFDFSSGSIPSSGYDIRTPFATIAVRGTRISIVAVGANQGVVVNEGAAQVEISGRQYGVTPGSCFIVQPGGGAVVAEGDTCAELLASVAVIDTLLASVEPGAGPVGAGVGGGSVGGGSGDQRDDDDPLVFPEPPASPG